MSGQFGGYVYWWQNGRLHWRRYVVPIDPNTPAQQCSRTAFGTGSTVWSDNTVLMPEQRHAWHTAAAKLQSSPRLGQSGPLTAQQHIVGVNALKERWGLPLLLEPPVGESPRPSPRPYRVAKCRTGRPSAIRVPIQVTRCQALTPPSSERPQTNTAPLPLRCRCKVWPALHFGALGSPWLSSPLAHTRRNGRVRELWRGG